VIVLNFIFSWTSIHLSFSHLELSLLLENVLFLGDLALFFPDVFHRFYDKDQQRRILTSWSYSFAIETEFYDEKSLEILSLVKMNFDEFLVFSF
jgi:hypothetical protein